MFLPKYKLKITTSEEDNGVICTGDQLALIVGALKNLIPDHIWYGADVEPLCLPDEFPGLEKPFLNKIGTDEDLLRLANTTSQFIWGVFIAVDSTPPTAGQIEVFTEDEPFRDIALENVLIEIRTFDTSFFEFYSISKDFLLALKNELQKPPISLSGAILKK